MPSCPAQWEGETESGSIYIRFRWGQLSGTLGRTIDEAIGGRPIFEWDDVDGKNGFMEYEELKRITGGVLDLPCAETNEEARGNPTISSSNPDDRAKNG